MNKKENVFVRLYTTSILALIVNTVTVWLKKQISHSFLVGMISSYGIKDGFYEKSFTASFFEMLTRGIKMACRVVTKGIEESMSYNKILSVKDKLLNLSLQSYGSGFCLCGFVSLIVTIVRSHARIPELLTSSSTWASVILLLVGLTTCFSKHSLCNALRKSAIASFLLFRVVGFRDAQIPSNDGDGTSAVMTMSAIGIVMGLLSAYISLVYIAVLLAVVVGVWVVLCCPEIGVMLCIFALPFVSTMQITLLAAAAAVSFLIKLIRGKRYVRIYKMDICVIVFAVTLLFLGGAASIVPLSSLKTVAMFLMFMCMYFVTANSLTTYKWVSKAAVSLVCAGTLSGLVGVYQHFVGFSQSLVWVDTEMFSDISERVIGTFDNPNVFGEFLIIILPVAIALFATRKGAVKYLSLIGAGIMGWSLILTYSRGAWLGFALALVVFLVLYDDVWVKLGILGLALSPFLIQFVPSSIMNRITSIGNLADTSTSYRVSIWKGAARMLGVFWPSGIGSGSAAFLKVYPAYALSGAGYAQHAHSLYFQVFSELGIIGFAALIVLIVYFFKMTLNIYRGITMWEIRTLSIAIAAGIGGYLIQGMTDYVWYNYRITLLFWLVLGVATALYKTGYREWGVERENIGQYKLKGRTDK